MTTEQVIPPVQQCPKGCGRLVRCIAGEYVNAAGAWKGFGHMCWSDGADTRGDNDDAPTRAEELADYPDGGGA